MSWLRVSIEKTQLEAAGHAFPLAISCPVFSIVFEREDSVQFVPDSADHRKYLDDLNFLGVRYEAVEKPDEPVSVEVKDADNRSEPAEEPASKTSSETSEEVVVRRRRRSS